ncbi:MAG TPA: DUF4956 domain-containing protein [Clostridia bacterium]|nr:DUF4956 domain-containing protein [Clostridia bacterium]
MGDLELFKYLIEGSSTYTLETITFNMAMTTILGLFIYFIYKKSYTGVLYSRSFNLSLVVIALTTSIIIMLIGSNLAISLGMVGALSIVRFRSAIKEPRDLAFLFWSIAIGLASGTGAFLIAGIGSIFIAALIMIFRKSVYTDNCYLLVVKGDSVKPDDIEKVLKQNRIKHRLRLHNMNHAFSEVTFEVYLKKKEGHALVEHFKGAADISEVNLVSFNGEITG